MAGAIIVIFEPVRRRNAFLVGVIQAMAGLRIFHWTL
jgi:hypothetical protein